MRDIIRKYSRDKYAKVVIGLSIILLSLLVNTKEVKAISNYSGDMDYTDIQGVIDDIMSYGNEFDFSRYVEKLINGEVKFSLTDIGLSLIASIKGEIKANLGVFGRLVSIALVAALFSNLSMAFKNSQVSDTGYYITYLLLFGVIVSSFVAASEVAVNGIHSLLEFMKVLAPAYFLAVGFSTGSTTSLIYYEGALMVITVADAIILKMVVPLINFYLIVTLANNLAKEDMLSKLVGLFENIIGWALKGVLAAVVSLGAIQGLIVPVADRVKRSSLLKASAAIPGVGDAIGGVAETILGAGMLLKNAIGVTGIVVIITMCAAPFIKLFMIMVIYKIGCAVLQPISDKRMVECLSASAKAAEMLLHAVFIGAVLFILSITIVAVTTGSAQ